MKSLYERILESSLIRKDGNINSGVFRYKIPEIEMLLIEIKENTSYLPEDSSISRRMWHIKNGKDLFKCLNCGNDIEWKETQKKRNGKIVLCGRYNEKYCSQICACTSEENKKQARENHLGKKQSNEHTKKLSESKRGKKRSEETKRKLAAGKIGDLNPAFGKAPWNKGLSGPNNPLFGRKRPDTGLSGDKNPAYGKSPSYKAGRGVNGKFNDYHFRSSLELFYLIYWYENDIKIESAENKKYRIKYTTKDGIKKSYSPDFYLLETNELVELKPERLQIKEEVLEKFNALVLCHPDKRCKFLGFLEISTFIQRIINEDLIGYYINLKLLDITDKQYEKLRRNYASLFNATL